MIRVSGPKISDVTKHLDGRTVSGVTYQAHGKPVGIQVCFCTDAADEQLAKNDLKKHLKEAFPVLRLYIEVI